MTLELRSRVLMALLVALVPAAAAGGAWLLRPAPGAAAERDGLTSFGSAAELRRYLKRLKAPVRNQVFNDAESTFAMDAAGPVAGQGAGQASITNNQEAGVDEGGIVKVLGETLIILRRGRLFTVSLAGGAMRPLDSIDAFPPGVDASGDWYDEMLVAGDRIVVVGYSYARGGTAINRFRLGQGGKLRFEDAYDLRSNDYYSSRNYASRLIGSKLVFYAPLDLLWQDDPLEALPGMRRWKRDPAFRPIARPSDIYLPPDAGSITEREGTTLHSVTSCDLAAATLDCSAVAVLGPWSRSFYVSPSAVYLWIASDWYSEGSDPARPSFVYRLPLDGGRPSAVATRGAPIDQFSFREDSADGVLNVAVQSQGGGDSMWAPEFAQGDLALLRLPLAEFGDGRTEAPKGWYRRLPKIKTENWSLHNRFVGPWLLYGAGTGYETPREGTTLVAVPVAGGANVRLPVSHAVDRIEVLGGDAIAVGTGANGLGFSTVELGGRTAALGDRYTLQGAAEGENRSHAFFFRASGPQGRSGLLGLPITREPEADPLDRFLGSGASIVFLRRHEGRLAPAGALDARGGAALNDGCKASCVDWYGNARPIFLGTRTFALLGYELVEGHLEGGRIREVARVSFAPAAAARSGPQP